MVKVNDANIPFRAKMTLAQALGESGSPMEGAVLILVDEQLVDRSQWETYLLNDGAEIRVLRILSGG